ncbi:hypothetical protein OQH60_03480 [Campylobacter sp. MIT 21-1685]|uniref:hypothetical protein n=1 Tax=unclassified Campylobacter TaxID=2593542 RepID=UPI00224B3B9B|nr:MULTISPECIES: hypothetical protein [unclassified Campylobacter]MCX2682924.1 hypothetical protein [Campylobacter sp. MIT 21-1684]MCX2751128.1 hypothetical protein [Campylobacter sp. MIT 21-1682]MCX2807405.1 hypothetical protein [Campylobacter sp. MIT 21-1685]
MKHAFTLFEFVITLVLFALISTFLSKAFIELHHLSFKSLQTIDTIIKANFTLLQIEKLLKPCINIHFQANTLHCLLKDENFLELENSNPTLINSTLVLEQQNGTFYSPKSDFLAQIKNKKALFATKQDTIYALVDGNITQIPFQDSQKLLHTFNHFIPLLARLDLKLENSQILYELRPQIDNDTFKQTGILAQNVSILELTSNKLKICLQTENNQQCLEKRLTL